MNDLLQTLVDEDFGYKKEGQNWGRAVEHSSLTINEANQKWYWNSQQMGGGVLDYLIKVRGLSKRAANEIIDIRGKIIGGKVLDETEKIYYAAYEKLVDVFWENGKEHREYWYKRCLRDSTIDLYRLGYYQGWNTVPLYIGDKFINFQCRRDEPKKFIRLWYKEEKWIPALINADMLALVDTIYITEGTIDALLLSQEGIPAVSQTSGAVYWSPKWYSLFSRVNSIFYIADNDEAGRIAARRVAKALGVNKTLIYQFEGKPDKYDTVDYFRDGGNAKEFKSMVESSSKYLFELGDLK